MHNLVVRLNQVCYKATCTEPTCVSSLLSSIYKSNSVIIL